MEIIDGGDDTKYLSNGKIDFFVDFFILRTFAIQVKIAGVEIE